MNTVLKTPQAEPAPARGTGDPRPPAPSFLDVDGATRFVKALPINNVPQIYAAVRAELEALAGAQLPARERARIAEVLRDQVAYLHTELARRYAGKPLPAGQRERDATQQAIALWHALWEQYSACLKPLLDGDPELASVKSKLLQRGLYVGKQLVLVYGLARRAPPPTVWQELHAYYRLAEVLDCAGTSVSDPLITNGVGISCYATYTHALLLGLADLSAMSVKQIQLTDRWLQMWARKVYPYPEPRDADGPLVISDLAGGAPATLTITPPANPTETTRYAYAGKLATSVRGRLKRLHAGANPAELQLGHDCSVEQCTALLEYLDWRWYQPPRRPPDAAPVSFELCAGGLDGAYFRIRGRTFDRRGALRPFGLQTARDLASLDALTDYDRSKEESERTWAWETWKGPFDGRDATLARDGAPHYRWSLEQLTVVLDGERKRLGYVSRVAQDDAGRLALSLRMWSGAPRAITVRPATTALAEEYAPIPAILLAETPEDKACLILPSRSFNPSRLLRTSDDGPEKRFRLTRLLQRGADFERVAFEHAD